MAKALELDQIPLIAGFFREETEQAINEHTSRRDNPHEVDAEQLGLGNVDNTADLNKPISKATQSALDDKADVGVFNSHKNDNVKHITSQERNIWNTASSNADNACAQVSNINTEISALNTAVAELRKQSQGSTGAVQDDLAAHIEDTSNPHRVTANQIGLGNVDNTSDVNKPVSTAQQAALNLKADKTEMTAHINDAVVHITATERELWNDASDTANTAYAQSTSLSESVANIEEKIKNFSGQAGGTQESAGQVQNNLTDHINDKTNPHQVTQAQIGLGNVDNTSDADKPVSTEQQAALDTKANMSDLSSHTGDTTKHITAAERTAWNGKQDAVKCITVSLTVEGWSGTGPFTQSVTAQGVTTGNLIISSPAPSSWENAGKAKVYCSTQAVNSLTFTCKKKPSSALTYHVLIQEVG